MEALTAAAAAARDQRLRARQTRRRRFHTNGVDGIRLRVELHNCRQAELEPVSLTVEGAELAETAARYLATVELFRSVGSSPRFT